METVTIFATNDIHGRFLQEGGAIDFARLAALKKKTKDCLLVDAGDATQGTPLAVLKKGLYPIQILNAVGYELTTIGNHEFDNITKDDPKVCELDEIIRQFKGDYLAANVLRKADHKNYIAGLSTGETDTGNGEYTVCEVNGRRLLFIGLATPAMSMDIKRMEDFEIKGKDWIESRVKAIIESVGESYGKKQKTIDAVIVLSHLGLKGKPEDYKSTDLAKNVAGIDLIIDGHSHDEYNQMVGTTRIVQAGCYGRKFSEITLNFEGTELKSVEAALRDQVYLEKQAGPDADVQTVIEDIKKQVEQKFAKEWAKKSDCTLWGGNVDEDRPYVLRAGKNIARYAQTNLGEIIGNAMISTVYHQLEGINQGIKNASDRIREEEHMIGAINGGAVRESIPWGRSIRSFDLYTVCPSPLDSVNESGFVIFRLTLGELKEILNHSLSKIQYQDQMLKASEGYLLNLSGLRMKVVIQGNELKADNQIVLYYMADGRKKEETYDLDRNRDQTVLFCTTKYIGGGGDGYETLKKKKPIYAVNTALFELLGRYILERSDGETFTYPCVSKNVEYPSDSFPKPKEVAIRLCNDKKKPLADEVVIAAFDRGEDLDYLVLSSNSQGVIKLTPPKGNSILRILCLMPFNKNKQGENLYGELYFQTYYMAIPDRVEACLLPVGDGAFPRAELAVFRHELKDSGSAHYSNYVNYISFEEEECTFLVLGGQIYQKKRSEDKAEAVSEIEFGNYGYDYPIDTFKTEYESYYTWGEKEYEMKLFLDSKNLD